MSKSSFFYGLAHLHQKSNKDRILEEKIIEIFNKHHEKYGRPRVTIELHRQGIKVNHKTVYRIMKKLNLKARIKRRGYHSYRGLIGKICGNQLLIKKEHNNQITYDRNFACNEPYQILGTDVTQFQIREGKLYLSPIIDFYTREVLAYDISIHPDYAQIRRMMNMLFKNHGEIFKGSILHSDQGYQYQMKAYQRLLKEHGIIQSMSRKGNCLDNSPTENFFARLKTEMFYDKEYKFISLKSLEEEIIKYIEYYNSERLVSRLKSTPIETRKRVLGEVV